MTDAFRNSNAVRFTLLTPDEQHARICALARDGWGEHEIAGLFGLHVRMVREVLAKRVPQDEPR